jgi:two-component system, OmpR family, sensor kinase
MTTGSLRTRVVVAALPVLVLALAVAVTAVTALYRASLDGDLHARLTAAAAVMQRTWPGGQGKQLIPGLAMEGIATDIRVLPHRPDGQAASSTATTSRGSLLVLQQTLPDGTQITYSASEQQITNSVRQLLMIQIVVSVAALAGAALLLVRGTAVALRPLAQIVRTAMRIAAGDRAQRLGPNRTDTELGRMAAAFDQMVDALEAAIGHAERAETAMRDFLADASHELRTPIAALQATAETLLREQPARPQRDALEATLARDAARLGRLAGDLLSLTRLEARHQFVRVDLSALARQAAERALSHAPAVRITLDLDEHPPAIGDPGALARLLANLLDNALAAVPSADPTITITVRHESGQAEVRVADNGPGIPDSQRERVFDRFFRLDRSTEGHGLGLAIARRIAREHGGDLVYEPSPTGAVFTLRLPVAAKERLRRKGPG